MKFIVKKLYTFAELETRWECGRNDLVQAVIDGELIPSVHIERGKYDIKQFESDYDGDADIERLFIGGRWDGEQPATDRCNGFHFLIWPQRTGISDCQFHYFSESATGHEEGEVCFELTSPVGIAHVLEHSVFMPKEVARVEAASDHATVANVAEKPLAKRERDTLLTIIAVLCNESKLDFSKAAKTASLIQGMADLMKVTLGETTIENHLKKIPDALGTRTR